jgi:outer membrane lipoprotein-sorting protein|tara:strand:+ start:1077 stop:1544 length:468 start_codon:yes stop_codon:yes gene_type:complete
MEIEVLSSALILVACISAGISACFIARGRTSINKHSRQRIKDFENDIKYLAESKKEEAKDYRQEILRLKGTLNKMKQGVTVTDTDMKNSGLGEVIMQLVPGKYRKAASFLIPQVEEAVKKDPALIEKVYEKIKSANSTNSQQTESGNQTQGIQSL